MWFYDDEPHKGTDQDDLVDDEIYDSAGYADWRIDWLFAAFIIVLASALAILVQPIVARLFP
jgi:hypothetical protein